MKLGLPFTPIVSHCPLCLSDEIYDTGLSVLDEPTQRWHLVFECDSCTGRFVADRPRDLDEIGDGMATGFASPQRVAEKRAHLAGKRLLDENDYPYSLIPLIESWSPGKRVLELGCGTSQLLPMLMQRGYDAIGFEADAACAQVARENGVTVVSGDGRKIVNIADIVGEGRFDCIVSDQVFEHMLDPVDTLRGLKPVLAEGGIVIFRFLNEGHWRRKAALAWARMRADNRPLPGFRCWNYFNERAARTCFSAADYEVLRLKRDVNLQSSSVGKVLPTLTAVLGLSDRVLRTIGSFDSGLLSNALTAVARPA